LIEVKDLVFPDLGRGSFVLYGGGVVLGFDVGEGMGAAAISYEERVALGEVAGLVRLRADLNKTAVTILTLAGRDTLGDDTAAGVAANMVHLGAGVGYLFVTGNGNGIKLTGGVVALQDHAGIFPGDGRAGLDLRPGDLCVVAFADAAFGDEVEDPALAVLITGIPVLNGRIFDLGVFQGNEFDHCGVQLVLVPHGGGAAFEIADIAAFIGDDQGPFELAGVFRVYPEVGGQFHGAADALG